MANKSLEEQFIEIAQEYSKELREDIEEGLTLAAIDLKNALEQNSPISRYDAEGHRHFKDSWVIKNKYKRVRYVGNTKTVSDQSGKNIPLSNILEYSEASPHKGFIQRTFNSISESLYKRMVSRIKK